MAVPGTSGDDCAASGVLRLKDTFGPLGDSGDIP